MKPKITVEETMTLQIKLTIFEEMLMSITSTFVAESIVKQNGTNPAILQKQ
jgi:hypothetical protein